MSQNQPLAFALLLGGGLLLTSALTKSSVADVIQGKAGGVANQGDTLSSSLVGATGSAVTSAASGSTASALPSYGTPPALGEGVALKGSAASTWATSILTAIGAPATAANMSSMVSWFDHEGGGGANNPLNTTLSAAGATGSINSVGVKSYGTPSAGVAATAQTLLGGYPAIVAALKAGSGLSGGGAVSSELSTWSGGGYSSL